MIIKGKPSRWTKLMSGVSQGSALGPLLFLLFTNDVDVSNLEIRGRLVDDTDGN